MVHGAPDWGSDRARVVTFGGIDLDELAARLGSPSWYDRRGEVVWYDQFEHGIEPWTIETTGTGGDGADVTAVWLTKGHSLRLRSGTDEGAQTQAERILFMPQLTRLGLETCICFGGSVGRAWLALSFLDGTYLQAYMVEVDPPGERVRIYDGDAAWVEVLSDMVINQGDGVFYPVKFVVDATTRKWVRLLFANQAVDLSAYRGTESANASAPTLDISLYVLTDDDASRVMWVDNVVLTQDEP